MAFEAVAGTINSFQQEKKEETSSTSLEPKDFFWDQFIKYISSAILALTVLNVSVEFLRGGGVQCFPPAISNFLSDANPDELYRDFSRSQSDYLNSYCSESIPSSEFFPIYILVQGILLVAPHFIWSAVFKGDFDSFFAVIQKLDRLRDRNTGMYDTTNFDRVEKLELEFGSKRKRIFIFYISKLCLQLTVCIGTIIFSETYFDDFSFTFQCPANVKNNTGFPENWPLNTTVPCVFATLRVLNLVRYGDYILTGMAIVLIGVGLLWCGIRHTKELGHVDIANFVFQSCLTAKSHVFPKMLDFRPKRNHTETCWYCSLPFALCFSCCKGCIVCSFRLMVFRPRIQNDLDFLQMTLFRADSSHGRVFKEIQIDKQLQKLHGRDHQLIHLFLNVQLDMKSLMDKREKARVLMNDDDDTDIATKALNQVVPRENDLHQFFRMSGFSGNPEKYAYTHYQSLLGNTEWKPVEGIRDRLYGFVKFCPKHVEGQLKGEVKTDMALDISFGSSGYALVLSRAFKTVVSVNFRPFFRNETKPVKKEKYYTNYINVDFPENIFTRSSETINEAVGEMVEPMFEDKKRPVDFIVVGPLEDDTKRVTVTLEIEMLYSVGIIEQEAILLAARPLQIGHRKTTKRYLKYEPPTQLFDHTFHNTEVVPLLEDEIGTDIREIDGCSGITVKCGDTECVFELIAYKYIGEDTQEEEPKIETLGDLIRQQEPQYYDNEHTRDQPILIGSANRTRQSQHSESDLDTSLTLSPPLIAHHQNNMPPLAPGGVYNFEDRTQQSVLQRQNTVDYSPQAREQKRKSTRRLTRKNSSLSTETTSRSATTSNSTHNNDLVTTNSSLELPDDNHHTYSLDTAENGVVITDNTEPESRCKNKESESFKTPEPIRQIDTNDASNIGTHWSKQKVSYSRRVQERRQSSSSTRLLPSIEESDNTSDDNELSLISPPPVFSD